MAARLPVELTYQIIDLSRHDLEALERYSCVSRVCRERALPYLFRALEVRDSSISRDAAFAMTRVHLRTYIQMKATRFAKFISSEAGRRMLAHVRQLVFLLSPTKRRVAPIWETISLANIAALRITSLRIWASNEFVDPIWVPQSLVLVQRLIKECRTNLDSLTVIGLAVNLFDVLKIMDDFTSLRYLQIEGARGGSAWPGDIAWPRMGRDQPLDICLNLRTLSIFMHKFPEMALEYPACAIRVTCASASAVEVTTSHFSSLTMYPLVRRFDLALKYSKKTIQKLTSISALLAHFPALAILEVSVPLSDAAPHDDSVACLAEFLTSDTISSPSLRTLVFKDSTHVWEMAEVSADEDEPANVESLYLDDYRWETLDAALALPKWHRVRRLVVSLQALRMQEAEDIERCFEQYAAIGLPGFASRGGTIRVVSTGSVGKAVLTDSSATDPTAPEGSG